MKKTFTKSEEVGKFLPFVVVLFCSLTSNAGETIAQSIAESSSAIRRLQHHDYALFQRMIDKWNEISQVSGAETVRGELATDRNLRESDIYPNGRHDHILLFRVTAIASASALAPIYRSFQNTQLFCNNMNCDLQQASDSLRHIFNETNLSEICSHISNSSTELPNFNMDTHRWESRYGDLARICDESWSLNTASGSRNYFRGLINDHIGGFSFLNIQRGDESFPVDPFVSFSKSPVIAGYFAKGADEYRLLVLSVPETSLQDSCHAPWLAIPGELMNFGHCGAMEEEREIDGVLWVNPRYYKDVITFLNSEV